MDNGSFRVAVLATVSVGALLIMWLSQPEGNAEHAHSS